MKKFLKKTTIVHVLRILYCYTSFDHPATQTVIVNYLNEIGLPCSRKTVGRNIGYLIECGVPIKRKNCKNGGYYYDFENDSFLKRSSFYQESEGHI